jgi:hypothetical protein
MKKRANVFLEIGAAVALLTLFLLPKSAIAEGPPGDSTQAGENRWVPSFAITGGANFQDQRGWVDSVLFEDGSPDPVPLEGSFRDNDLQVAPFVAASLELMTPAFDIPTRPRLFVSGEILPTFATKRTLVINGDPNCIRGPEPGAPCAVEETGNRTRPFGEDGANGAGSKTTAKILDLAYGANLGVAFPFRIGKRQLRVKPSLGWINYGVEAKGLVVSAMCTPVVMVMQQIRGGCVDVGNGAPAGFLRETELKGKDMRRFNGIGPGLDLEMDAARFGPIGAALFLGARAYYIVGNRSMEFGAQESFNDQFGNDVAKASFKVEPDAWLFRAHVGIRFQWLGGVQ